MQTSLLNHTYLQLYNNEEPFIKKKLFNLIFNKILNLFTFIIFEIKIKNSLLLYLKFLIKSLKFQNKNYKY